MPSYPADQLPCVRPGHARNLKSLHHTGKAVPAAEIGRAVIIIPDDQAADGGAGCFKIVLIDAVITNQGISHDNELVRIGRV